jgi:hypothetical protein
VQTYYYYDIGANGRIVARHDIKAIDDADAVAAAWAFSAQDKKRGFEVWVGTRLVFKSEMGTTSSLGIGGETAGPHDSPGPL